MLVKQKKSIKKNIHGLETHTCLEPRPSLSSLWRLGAVAGAGASATVAHCRCGGWYSVEVVVVAYGRVDVVVSEFEIVPSSFQTPKWSHVTQYFPGMFLKKYYITVWFVLMFIYY